MEYWRRKVPAFDGAAPRFGGHDGTRVVKRKSSRHFFERRWRPIAEVTATAGFPQVAGLDPGRRRTTNRHAQFPGQYWEARLSELPRERETEPERIRALVRHGSHVQNSVRTQLIARRVANWKTLRLPQ
jgi:hypothetical protein